MSTPIASTINAPDESRSTPFVLHALTRRFLPLLVCVAGLGLVLACQPASPSAQPQPASTQTLVGPRVVEWSTDEYRFNAPDTLPAGVVTIRLTNNGHEPHHGQLLRLNDSVSFEQFADALQQEGEAALRLTTGQGGPGTNDPHGSNEVTLDLQPGTYALVCFIPSADGVPHLAKGMLKPIQVTAQAAASAPAPHVNGMFMLRDFSIEMPDTLTAGRTTYKVTNVGQQMHELNVVRLAPGKGVEDLLAWEKAPAGPPPYESAGGMNALSTNGAGYMTLDLHAGTYVAVCRVPDPASGMAHEHMGMTRAFTVKG